MSGFPMGQTLRTGLPGVREPAEGESFYRFTVRCDRARLKAIEAAARKERISVEAFVQQHFEAILDARPAASDARLKTPPGLTAISAAVFDAMALAADETGRVQLSLPLLASSAGVQPRSVERAVARLIDLGHVERLSQPVSHHPTVYRLVRPA